MSDVTEAVLEQIGREIAIQAIRNAPVDNGFLRSNIGYKVSGDVLIIGTGSEVGKAHVDYADKMEYGSPPEPSMSPREEEDIIAWAERHGLTRKEGKGVVMKIKKKGIEAGTPENPKHVTSLGRNSYRPFLRTALHQTLPRIQELMRKL